MLPVRAGENAKRELLANIPQLHFETERPVSLMAIAGLYFAHRGFPP